jgi:spermidine/putrescine transport system ATP-binding protein
VTAAPPVAGLERVRARYRGAAEDALQALDLDVRDGEFLSLLGPSGSGKTTVLRVVAGFLAPVAGRVRLAGRDVTAVPPHRRDVNTVFQHYALFPRLTVRQNVAFGLRRRGVPATQVARRVGAVLELVDLQALAERRPGQLSGGQQQRVALARALVNRPRLVLLDEPMSALDAHLRERMRRELRDLQRATGTTFVLVTHDRSEALSMSDRVAVLAGGRLRQVGTPEALYDSPADAFVAGFLGPADIATTGPWTRAGDRWSATCEAGTVLTDRPPRSTTVVVRPHDARIDLGEAGPVPGDGRCRLPGVVRWVSFQGAEVVVSVELASGALWTVARPARDVPRPQPGQRCQLTWDAGRTRTVDDPKASTEEDRT